MNDSSVFLWKSFWDKKWDSSPSASVPAADVLLFLDAIKDWEIEEKKKEEEEVKSKKFDREFGKYIMEGTEEKKKRGRKK